MDPHRILYEDNHMIAVNKAAGELVQGDKSGDQPLCETIKADLKEKYRKPGKTSDVSSRNAFSNSSDLLH